jgi:hypothetical protein
VSRRYNDKDCDACFQGDCDCECATCVAACKERKQSNETPEQTIQKSLRYIAEMNADKLAERKEPSAP